MQSPGHIWWQDPPGTDDTGEPVRHRSIDDLLAQARCRLIRLTPRQAARELADGTLLVDVRADLERRAEGGIPGSLVVDRDVLEWRLDPCSSRRIEETADIPCPPSSGARRATCRHGGGRLHDLGLPRSHRHRRLSRGRSEFELGKHDDRAAQGRVSAVVG
jgi:hypothetical protein